MHFTEEIKEEPAYHGDAKDVEVASNDKNITFVSDKESFSFSSKVEEYFANMDDPSHEEPDILKRANSQKTNTHPFTLLDQELKKLKAPDATGFRKSGFQCFYCDRKFKDSKQWKNHIRAKHTRETPFHCSMCDKKYCSYSSLASHLLTHGEKNYKCDSCSKAFFQKVQLKVHKQLHHEGPVLKKFSCEECDKKFRTKGALDAHLFTHGARSFMCDLCGYKANRPSDLASHNLKIHSEDRPTFGPCSTCGKTGFADLRTLRDHESRHSSNRDFKCEKCGKGFKTRDDLKTHSSRHEDPKEFKYGCRFCDKKYPQSSTRNDHELLHTGEKPYHCSTCDYKCNNGSNLRKHMKLKHGEKSISKTKRLVPGHSSKRKNIAIDANKSEATATALEFASIGTKRPQTEKDSHLSSKSKTVGVVPTTISNRTSEEPTTDTSDQCVKAKEVSHQNDKTEEKKDLGNAMSSNDTFETTEETELSTTGGCDSKPCHRSIVINNIIINNIVHKSVNTPPKPQVLKSELISAPSLLNDPETLKTEDSSEYSHSTEDLKVESQGVLVKEDESVKEEAYIVDDDYVGVGEDKDIQIPTAKESAESQAHSIDNEYPGDEFGENVVFDGVKAIEVQNEGPYRLRKRKRIKEPLSLLDQELLKLKAGDGSGYRPKGFKCSFCGEKFADGKRWKNHVRAKHTRETPFHCSMCEKKYCSYSALSSHLLTHGEKKYKCNSCSKAFFQKVQLKVHNDLHHSGPVAKHFSCDQCNMKFRAKSTLQSHLVTHSDVRAHMCETCGQKFKTLESLKSHNFKMHTEQRPSYGPCSTCGKSGFADPRSLKQHESRHTATRNFKCETCNKGFKTKEDLQTHMPIHNDPTYRKVHKYPCSHCGKMFTQHGARQIHERIHTGEKPFKCSVCDFRCVSSCNLKKHMKKHGDL